MMVTFRSYMVMLIVSVHFNLLTDPCLPEAIEKCLYFFEHFEFEYLAMTYDLLYLKGFIGVVLVKQWSKEHSLWWTILTDTISRKGRPTIYGIDRILPDPQLQRLRLPLPSLW